MNRKEFLKLFWTYYQNLEKRFLITSNYVEINEKNFQTFSTEYVSLLLNICSEIDVLLKEMCGFNQEDSHNIVEYFSEIQSRFPNIIQEKVKYSFKNIELKPFENWTAKNSPDWWKKYNGVKHARLANFEQGNLKNVLNALAALYILERYQLKYIVSQSSNPNDIDIPDEDSTIFELELLHAKTMSLSRCFASEYP